MNTVGGNIKKARQARGLSQDDLARIINTTKSAISRYESGKREPKYDTIKRIANALSVSVSYLLSGGDVVSQSHFANGVHIYRNFLTSFKVVESFLEHHSSDSCDILYQDEYLLIAVDKNSPATDEELKKILDAYVPHKERVASEDVKLMLSAKEGEFHTQMNTAFFELNFSGKQEAARRVRELTEIRRYCAETTPESPPAPTEGTDTTPSPDAPGTPPEGE